MCISEYLHENFCYLLIKGILKSCISFVRSGSITFLQLQQVMVIPIIEKAFSEHLQIYQIEGCVRPQSILQVTPPQFHIKINFREISAAVTNFIRLFHRQRRRTFEDRDVEPFQGGGRNINFEYKFLKLSPIFRLCSTTSHSTYE